MTDEAAKSAEPEETADSSAEATAEETRRRFREALERKKHEAHEYAEAHESGGKGVGNSQVLSGRRQFRRKSG
jgi:hypothetical protein